MRIFCSTIAVKSGYADEASATIECTNDNETKTSTYFILLTIFIISLIIFFIMITNKLQVGIKSDFEPNLLAKVLKGGDGDRFWFPRAGSDPHKNYETHGAEVVHFRSDTI